MAQTGTQVVEQAFMATEAERGTSSGRKGSNLQLLLRTGLSVTEVWPVARDLLSSAERVGPPLLSLEDVYQSLLAEKRQLWMINDTERFLAAMITDLLINK
jgi:hypothetical protein